MAAIEEWGDLSRAGLDLFVSSQRQHPLNFKDLTDSFMRSEAIATGDLKFFLSMMLATAVIELAGRAES